MPDIISSVVTMDNDSLVTRMRAEGLKMSEIMDPDLMQEYGNIFVTANARYANTVAETREEALLLVDESWRNAHPKKYSMVPHPGLQPGDAGNFTEAPNTQTAMIVRGQTMTVGFSAANFLADQQCDVVPYDRG